jgi:CheY-like chemotaxis protein
VALAQQPDLILLDIMMPKMSGYEVCRQIKQDPQTKDISVLMVTALKEVGDIEKAVAAGADDFLTKPVHRLELTTRVRSLVRVRHLKSERDRLLAYIAEVEREIPPGSDRR